MKYTLLLLGIVLSFQSYAQITLIPDENFEGYLIDEGIDTDGLLNGQVNTVDIEGITELSVVNLAIENLSGIEGFTALEKLNCSENLDLETIDISSNSSLREFYAQFCAFSTIDFSNNTNLEIVYIPHNQLTSLAFTNHPALENLTCGNPEIDIDPFNQISSLDLSGAQNLKILDVSYMFEMNSINFQEIPLLTDFYGRYCGFTSLDFSNNSNLDTLILGGFDGGIVSGQSNNLNTLDLSSNPNLTRLDVELTNINSLNLQNGNNLILTSMRAPLNDPLFCVQVDDATAANAGEAPYESWTVDNQVFYSENCTLSIGEVSRNNFVLYPNPVDETLHVIASQINIEDVSILNIQGQKIMSLKFQQNQQKINANSLPTGVYFLKAVSDSGHNLVRKFVKR